MTATTPGARSFIGAEAIAITKLPFTVGRQPDEHEAPPVITPDLTIPEPGPYRLSRAHFSLVARNGEVAVRDLASTLGTIVNDRAIGRDFPVDSALLHRGENTIVAGGRGSPFAFAVTLS
jgi:CRP/FNR family transcriptional regulator, cyclic AMP receptor protein